MIYGRLTSGKISLEVFSRPIIPGGAGGAGQILKDQLLTPISYTLYQPGGAENAHHITIGTPGFSDLPSALFSEWLTKAYVIRSRKKYLMGLLSHIVYFGNKHGQIKGQTFYNSFIFFLDLLKLIG